MDGSLKFRLATMMFAEYGLMGLWSVTLGSYLMAMPQAGGLNFSALQVGAMYGTLPLASTIAPMFMGLLADRLFAIERLLAVIHLLGVLLLGGMFLWCRHSETLLRDAFHRQAAHEMVDAQRSVADLLAELESLKHPARAAPAPPAQIRALEATLEPHLARISREGEVAALTRAAFTPLLLLMFAYAILYMPSITLCNSLTLQNLSDQKKQYGLYRAFGTLGWIVAGVAVGLAVSEVSPRPMLYAAFGSLLLAAGSLLLPHTPPTRNQKTLAAALGLPALKLLAENSFRVYVLASLASTALMQFHNSFTNKNIVDLDVPNAAAWQTLGQPTEILGALLIAWLWQRIGIKRMLCLGLFASAARFLAYASQNRDIFLWIGLPLHGFGFSFFYIPAAIFIDLKAPPDLRSSAQGLMTVVSGGLGGVFGSWFAGKIVASLTHDGITDWRTVWLVPALGTLAAAVYILLCFPRNERFAPAPTEPAVSPAPDDPLVLA